MPIDHADHIAAAQLAADQHGPRDQQHADFMRQRVPNITSSAAVASSALPNCQRSSSGDGTLSWFKGPTVRRPRQMIATVTKTQASATSAGKPHAAANRQKSRPPTCPITMFCGLPIRVAAEPALAARPML